MNMYTPEASRIRVLSTPGHASVPPVRGHALMRKASCVQLTSRQKDARQQRLLNDAFSYGFCSTGYGGGPSWPA